MDSLTHRCSPALSTAGACRSLIRAAAFLALIALAVPARASMRPADPARLAGPTLASPSRGARLVESAVRLAFQTPGSATLPALVLSRRPFDPSSWTAIPDDADLVVRPARCAPLS